MGAGGSATKLPVMAGDTGDKSPAGFLVEVTADALNVRKGLGTSYVKAGCIRDKGTYTIIEKRDGWDDPKRSRYTVARSRAAWRSASWSSRSVSQTLMTAWRFTPMRRCWIPRRCAAGRRMVGMKRITGNVTIPADCDVWPHEVKTAKALAVAGHDARFVRKSNQPYVRTADLVMDGEVWEMKSPKS
jgi:hypothetical protein